MLCGSNEFHFAAQYIIFLCVTKSRTFLNSMVYKKKEYKTIRTKITFHLLRC